MRRGKSTEALGGVAAPRAPQETVTGFAGSNSAVSVGDDTTRDVPGSITKEILVTGLVTVWEIAPNLAIALAYAIAWVWPGFRGA